MIKIKKCPICDNESVVSADSWLTSDGFRVEAHVKCSKCPFNVYFQRPVKIARRLKEGMQDEILKSYEIAERARLLKLYNSIRRAKA